MSRKTRVLLFSGGAESVLSLFKLRKKWPRSKIELLHFDYGQKAVVKEQAAGVYYAELFRCTYRQFPLSITFLPPGIEFGIGENHVPSRNMIFIGYAVHHCVSNGISELVLPFTNEPNKPRSDSSRQYLETLRPAIKKTYPELKVVTNLTSKADNSHAVLLKFGVDVSRVWSCDSDGHYHCGKCNKCKSILSLKNIAPYVKKVPFYGYSK